ncbi:MAG: VWA domain-containing protein [Chloroflexi bacterium]|nr:VWA domain-containing protein [Chloroflexota bacterium]
MRVLRWSALLYIGLVAMGVFAASAPQTALAQASGGCVIDAVLLIDTGGSAAPEDFDRLKAFAAATVGALPMGGVRLGVIGFDQTAQARLGLSGDGGAVAGAIGGLSVTGGAADFRVALEAGQALLAESRPYVTRALVLITDGISATDAYRRGELLRAEQIAIITVGAGGGVNRRELFGLATPSFYYGGEQFTVFQPRIDRLPESVGPLAFSLCSAPAVVGGTVSGRTRDERGYPIILPYQGVTVTLLNPDDEPLATTVTDENGSYRFYVAPGTYALRVELPPGATFAPGNDGYLPLIRARLASINTRGYTLLEINF